MSAGTEMELWLQRCEEKVRAAKRTARGSTRAETALGQNTLRMSHRCGAPWGLGLPLRVQSFWDAFPSFSPGSLSFSPRRSRNRNHQGCMHFPRPTVNRCKENSKIVVYLAQRSCVVLKDFSCICLSLHGELYLVLKNAIFLCLSPR